MTISGGGAVTNTTASLADRLGAGAPPSSGTVTVTGAGSTWTNGGMLTIGNRGAGTLTIAAGGAVFAGGSGGTGAVRIAQVAGSTGALNIGAAAASAAAAPGTLNAASVTFGAGAGTINFNHTAANHVFAPVIAGGGAVNVLAGSTTLSAANTYTGPTTVSGGLLRVTGSLASPTVSVASGASLAGTGTLTGATTVAGGGNLIGAAGGTLTLGALTLADTSNVNVTLAAPSSTALFNVTGALTLDGRLNVANGGGFGLGSYRLFDYGGAFANNGLVINSLPAGFNPGDWEIDIATAGQVNLMVQAGPGEQYWDGANMTPGGVPGGRGGTGVWNAANTNWTNAAGTINARWASEYGVFGGAAGTVTVAGAQDFLGLRFVTGGYNLVAGAAGGLRTSTPGAWIDVATGTASLSVPIVGPGGLAKTGSGTLILAGVSDYAGPTSVQAGVLQLDGLLQTSPITVMSDAVLTGSGSAVGGASILDGGVLRGASGQVLTLGELDLGAGANLEVTLGAPSSQRLFAVTGGLGLDGVLHVAAGPGFSLGDYRLFDYGGALSDGGLVIATVPTGFNPGDWAIDVATPGQVNLLVRDGPGEQFWDGGHLAPGGVPGGRGGPGVWTSAATNWTNAAGTINGPWAGGRAVFAGAAGRITVEGEQRFRGLRFATSGYEIGGDGVLVAGSLAEIAVEARIARIGATISGEGGLLKTGGGELVLDAVNSFSGGIIIDQGRVTATTTGALSQGHVEIFLGAGLDLVGDFDAGNLRIINLGRLRLADRSTAAGARIESLAGGEVDISVHDEPGVEIGSLNGGSVRLGDRRLTLGGLGLGDTISGVISGAGGLTKVGMGRLNLAGENTYLGLTEAAGGQLWITGRIVGDAVVREGGRLAGTGVIGGHLDVEAGGALEGRAGEQLRMGSLTLAEDSVLRLSLGPPSQQALFAVDGDLDLAGALFVGDDGGFGLGSYRLIDYGGALSRAGLVIGSLPMGFNPGDWRIDTSVFGQVSLVVADGEGYQYWDGVGLTPGGVQRGRGGPGVWNASAANWTNLAGDINAPWAGQQATFAGTGGAVQLEGQLAVGALRFLADGYRLAGAGGLTLAGLTPIEVGSGLTAQIDAPISGAGRLAKTGAGRLVLTGAQAYAGPTNVWGGALRVDGALASPAVTVASGAALEGSGSLSGAISVAAGGRLAPGSGGAGTLTLGSLHLAEGAQLDYDLAQAGAVGGPNDLIEVVGDLVLDGAVNVADVGGFGAGVYRLINYGGALTDNGLEVGSTPLGVAAEALTVQTAVASQVNLVYAPGAGQGPRPIGGVQFWDGAGPAADGRIDGGAGAWGGTAANWTSADGRASNGWGGGFAVFQGDGGRVSVASPVAFTGLQFMSPGYYVGGESLSTDTAETVIRIDPGVSAEIASVISGSGGLVKRDLGELVLSNANSYSGGTAVLEGVLRVGSDSALGDAAGGLTLDGGTLALSSNFDSGRAVTLGAKGGMIDTDGRSASLSGVISGAGGLTKTGGGVLLLTGSNAYAGGLQVLGGSVTGDTASLRAPIRNEAVVNFDQAFDGGFDGALFGAGVLNKLGAGLLAFTGDGGGFAGQTNVLAGRLQVEGALGGALYVGPGAQLEGAARVGPLAVAGAVSPGGGGFGVLTVEGDYAQFAGSTYLVDIDPAGRSDLISVSGATRLAGAVKVAKLPGEYAEGLRYTILTARGGISGAYAELQQDLPFVDLKLNYGADAVHLDVTRNGAAFASVAKTRNQAETAAASQTTEGASLQDRIALLNASDARAAFDALSGEAHASLRRSLLDDSRYLRTGVDERLRAEGAEGTWAFSFGARGQVGGDGNAAGLDRDLDVLLLGGDLALGGHARLGFATGQSRTRLTVGDRLSGGVVSSTHLAGHLGARWGDWRTHLSAGYSWHAVETSRGVAFEGFQDVARASYAGSTAQLFGEMAYALKGRSASLEPFVGFAHVTAAVDGFSEQGSEAALAAAGGRDSFTTVSVGLRPSLALQGEALRLQGAIAWRRALDEVAPASDLRFRAGGEGFSPAAAPIARDALSLEARAEFQLSPNTAFAIDYGGQIASGAQDHAVKAGFSLRF